MTVIEFKRPEVPVEEPTDHHIAGKAFCIQCDHEWAAVAPVGTVFLECPECKSNKGLFKFECSPSDQLIFECSCGNQLFHLLEDGQSFCPNCALSHKSWED